jgi:hypothetical protein
MCTVKVVSWGPEVESGRCPNLGFFCWFALDDMLAIMLFSSVNCEVDVCVLCSADNALDETKLLWRGAQ